MTNRAVYSKTRDDHLSTLNEMVKLKIHFMHQWLAVHKDESFSVTLIERVDIWRKTHVNGGGINADIDVSHPDWVAMAEGLHECYARNSLTQQRDNYVNEAFAILKDSIAERSDLDFEQERAGVHLENYDFGSIRCDAPRDNDDRTVFVHVANAIAPDSIFNSPSYLPNCLLQMMDFAEAEFGATALCTTTWLNSYPAWQALFPYSWLEKMGPDDDDVKWHYGFWGQFLNARGCFNYKAGSLLRKTGAFPYAMRSASCTFHELRKHLLNN